MQKSIKGIIYGTVFFIMVPFCFQIAKSFDRVFQYLTQELIGGNLLYMFAIFTGLMSGVFIIVMMFLYRRLAESCAAGCWAALGIMVFNTLISFATPFINAFSICSEMFFYFYSSRYYNLIVMLLIFIIADICLRKIKKRSLV